MLVEGHASYRGIQRCLEVLGHRAVSLGTIAAVIAVAQWRALRWFATYQAPGLRSAVALDELSGRLFLDPHDGPAAHVGPPGGCAATLTVVSFTTRRFSLASARPTG
ncbi:MAG: hypothetical protein HYY04_10185 [Chloroflexi bacterium]|nr:hypothetical protein [Chloroflexota bacterium]